MTELHTRLNVSRLNFPLATLWVGQLSSAVLAIECIPDDIETVVVKIGRTPDGQTPREDISVVATLTGGGCRAYFAPFCFPDVSNALKYHIVGVDAVGNNRWLGTGALVVMSCPADGSGETPPIVPRDTYIRNPVTGLYHLLTATADDEGNITLDLAAEGIER